MNRLITKDKYGWYNPIDHNAVCDKLYKLEELEEELDCPLEVVFKALKTHKVRAIHPINKNIEEAVYVTLYYLGQRWCLGFNSLVWNEKERECDSWDLFLDDYKKTWWLSKTKEE